MVFILYFSPTLSPTQIFWRGWGWGMVLGFLEMDEKKKTHKHTIEDEEYIPKSPIED